MLENKVNSISIHRSLICHSGNIAKIYELVKYSNKIYLSRPVVVPIGTPTYKIASFVADIITLVKKLHTIYSNFDNEHILIFFNVVSLFTNTLIKLSITFWEPHFHTLNSIIPKDFPIRIMHFIFNNSVFTYKGIFANKYMVTAWVNQ